MAKPTIDAIAFSAYLAPPPSSLTAAQDIVHALVDSGCLILDSTRRVVQSDPYDCIKDGNIFLQGLCHEILRPEELQEKTVPTGSAALGYSHDERWLFISQSAGFRNTGKLSDLADHLRALSDIICHRIQIEYGWLDKRRSVLPNLRRTLEGKLQYLCWYNYFGPSIVDRLGENNIASAPVYKSDRFDNGAIGVQITKEYWDWVNSDQTQAVDYFRQFCPDIQHFATKSRK